MTIQQSRMRLVGYAVAALSILSPLVLVTALLITDSTVHLTLPMWCFLTLADLACLTMFLDRLGRLARPCTLEIDRDGLVFTRRGERLAWGWRDVSNFRLGPHAASVHFDVSNGLATCVVGTLPGCWVGGQVRLVAHLNAADRQFTDPSWTGLSFQETEPAPKHSTRDFAFAFCFTLVGVFGVFFLRLAQLRAHH